MNARGQLPFEPEAGSLSRPASAYTHWALALGGLTSAAEAARHIAAWNAGALPLLAFHPAAAGHGLNLQFGGSRMAWLSPSWSAELTEQAIARIYRPGQTQHVTIHVCIASRTVDEMKRDRVLGKMSAQEAFRRHLEQI